MAVGTAMGLVSLIVSIITIFITGVIGWIYLVIKNFLERTIDECLDYLRRFKVEMNRMKELGRHKNHNKMEIKYKKQKALRFVIIRGITWRRCLVLSLMENMEFVRMNEYHFMDMNVNLCEGFENIEEE